ncbi:MAG: von Willebrand factor type A domain-containing protein [Atopobiaceae bacterium]|nr:von Willebrand factor type A domain-containing protein [Atopobiaceae bacterium]
MNATMNRMTKLLACLFAVLFAGTLAACFSAPDQAPAGTGEEKISIGAPYDTGFVAYDCYEEGPAECGFWYGDPIAWNTEEYGVIREGGFLSTRANPLSTLSADVDTASYANLRRMVFDGYGVDEIPAGAVRIEEMLNYFTYDYAEPAAGERFSVTTHLGPCPWNPETRLLTLGFATARENTEAIRGRNLVFLIDVSGSMDSRDKLDLLKDSFEVLVRSLDRDDRISIVTYASGEELILEGARGDEARTIMRAIDRLEASGSTNGERGLELAYEVAERNFIEGGVNRIIMASDGDLNVGMTSTSDLYDYVSAKRATGIYLSVLGFGTGNYKDTKMETLADNGNGSYHYIDCIGEAERVFDEKLCANLVPFADDVKVQVEFNPALVKGYRLIGYENREMADEDFANDARDAADVGPGAQFTVCYEIVPAGSAFEVGEPELRYATPESAGDASFTGELAQVSLRYRAFDDGQVHEQRAQIADADSTDADWRFAAAVIEFGMYLRSSEYAGTTTPASILELASAGGSAADRAGFVELVDYLLCNA